MAREYGSHPAAQAFVTTMVERHGFERGALERLFAAARYQDAIVKAMDRPAERVKPWHEYRAIFLTEKRIRDGVDFWRANREVLARAEQDYGVDPAVVVAIIGVETFYGRVMGGFRVLDALATLAFDYPKRSQFFSRELEQYLLLAREQGIDPLALKGSYAGAMGYGQFIPSSYRSYAIDYNGDRKADIWNNPTDAIGSVANYFARHGWQRGGPVAVPALAAGSHDPAVVNVLAKPVLTPAELAAMGFRPQGPGIDAAGLPLQLEGIEGAEYWLAYENFYVITRYNHSHRYAMAVFQLARELSRRMADAQG
ncbi:MAG TPA: lytic murein transglycosylase B [Porticoccaceae bacterium]|nr:lytic murein transglycosylase B [Porticoccaceae bacterium]